MGVNGVNGANEGANNNTIHSPQPSAIEQGTEVNQTLSDKINPDNPISQIINKIITASKNKDVDISDVITKLKRNKQIRKGIK